MIKGKYAHHSYKLGLRSRSWMRTLQVRCFLTQSPEITLLQLKQVVYPTSEKLWTLLECTAFLRAPFSHSQETLLSSQKVLLASPRLIPHHLPFPQTVAIPPDLRFTNLANIVIPKLAFQTGLRIVLDTISFNPSGHHTKHYNLLDTHKGLSHNLGVINRLL